MKKLLKNTNRNGKIPFLLTLIAACIFYTVPAYSQVLDSSRTEGLQIKIFNSAILGEKRKIRIQLPANSNPYDAYPVLYLLDGEAQTTMVAGQIQYLSEAYKIIPNMIVVSIDNTDRMRDLTPTHTDIGPDGKVDTSAKALFKTSGGGEKFLQFIKQELMPYIESRYRIAPFKILSGHSLGGLMAIYCLIHHPEYFNAYIAISPSLQWDNEVMLKMAAEKLDNKKLLNKILFFSDANEDAAFHQKQLKLDSILQKKNITGLKYKRMFYPEETHISEPVKASYDGIRFIYPKWHLPYNSSAFKKTMTSSVIKDHYTALTKEYGYNVIPSHDEIIQIARFLRNDTARINDAIELLQMNASNYPTSSLAFETLGDTYLKMADTKKAADALVAALRLDPTNEKIAQKIKSIQ